MPDTPTPNAAPYPGRPELDTANARFRRAVARLQKEAVRHDPELTPRLSAIVTEAAEHLTRLAAAAEAAERTSARNRAHVADIEERVGRTLRAGVRRGDPRALALQARLAAWQAPRDTD